MNTIPFVHEGLGNSSYLVELGEGRAILVDPDRTINRYLDTLTGRNLELIAIFETHLHADFVSGAKELAARTGTPVFLPAAADARFAHHPVRGGQTITLDGNQVTALASPGHTPEHLSYAVRMSGTNTPLLFSGGALIVGGAARTDLISPAMTDSLTRAQFKTLRLAFSGLPDETVLYPTHGGGSFCSIGTLGERISTLGVQRRENPLMAIEDEDDFAEWFPSLFSAVPNYFYRLRPINQLGPKLRVDVELPRPLDPDEFAVAQPGCLVVDARSKEEYAEAHLPGSFSNAYRDVFAIWLGWLAPAGARLLFISGDIPVERLVDESMLVGYESFTGWLQGGIDAWRASGRTLQGIELATASQALKYLVEGAVSLDVREPREHAAGHIEGSIHIPLGSLPANTGRIPSDRPVVVYCGHGERASTAASILEAGGFTQIVNLDGGMGAWQSEGLHVAR